MMLRKHLCSLHRGLASAEDLLMLVIVISMAIIAVTQIIMRNTFGGGLLWADAYTRISVLWIAMLGAMSASRSQKHIAIDLVMQRLPLAYHRIGLRISHALTALVCFITAWFSTDFVLQERSFAAMAFGQIPVWWCQSIIPVAFVVMGLRYVVAVFFASSITAETTS